MGRPSAIGVRTTHSLPIFIRLSGRPVILTGAGPAADAKRRLLERAGARVVPETDNAALAIVADGDAATVARLRARGILVNATDQPALCDFTLPAIVDRDPVLVAIGTNGASAGLAKALRQRLETILPASLGRLATALAGARAAIRDRWRDAAERRGAIDRALDPGGRLDPLVDQPEAAVAHWLDETDEAKPPVLVALRLRSADPDDLTLREARLLGQCDRIFHRSDIPSAILDRARADAARIACDTPTDGLPGLSLDIGWADR